MKVLIDTNVLLDFLLEREPFKKDAEDLFTVIAKGGIFGKIRRGWEKVRSLLLFERLTDRK